MGDVDPVREMQAQLWQRRKRHPTGHIFSPGDIKD